LDPLDFLAIARRFETSAAESERRTSVGRSYYAVFNHLRKRLEPLKPLPTTVDAHTLVSKYLADANNRDLKSLAQTLNDLRRSRNVADYEMETVVEEAQSRLACQRATNAIRKSQDVPAGTLRAAIDTLPTHRP
jgi:hypothetical protein